MFAVAGEPMPQNHFLIPIQIEQIRLTNLKI